MHAARTIDSGYFQQRLRGMLVRAMANPIACKQKRELLEQLKQIGTEMATLQQEELDALLAGNIPADSDLRMENAREMRKLLIERLRNHITEHGC
jgi:hypothetical protein